MVPQVGRAAGQSALVEHSVQTPLLHTDATSAPPSTEPGAGHWVVPHEVPLP